MKKKIIAVAVITIAILCACMPMMNGCVDKEPEMREVELELVNPNTGEILLGGERIKVPKTKTKVEVRIKDKETGQYLTDDDLPETTIEDSCGVSFRPIDWDDTYGASLGTHPFWPLPEQLHPMYDNYFVVIFFDCYPKGLQDPKFYRKYMWTSVDLRLYLE